MKDLIKEFEEHLTKIVRPVLKDDEDDDLDTMDLGIDSVGSELDLDDQGGASFKQDPMYIQLGKVLDSQGNPKPVDTVTTDDGKTFKVSPNQAKALRMLLTIDSSKVKPQIKDKFTKDLQTSSGFADFADIKDYHEIAQLFVKRYLG